METSTRGEARQYTRREFLIYQTIMDEGTPIFMAQEAVASTALEHPEWDMDEKMTWAEWRRQK